METTGGTVPFSKLSIFIADFSGSHFLVGIWWVQKDRQFGILLDKSICESNKLTCKPMLRENINFCDKQTIKKKREILCEIAKFTLAKTLTRQ